LPVEFLVELVDFPADGVPGGNNGRRRSSTAENSRPDGRSFSVRGSAPKRPLTARLARYRRLRRRSPDQTESGRWGLAAGTGLHAPFLPLAVCRRNVI